MKRKQACHRGEVWIVDLGTIKKIRPCLLLTGYPLDDELTMLTVVYHTTSVRDNRWELNLPKSFLKPGVFHFQYIESVNTAQLVRKLGSLNTVEMDKVGSMLRLRLLI